MPHTILLVQAQPATRRIRADVFRNAGYEVYETASGTDLPQLASARKPALVIIGLPLGEIDGCTVCERLKADPRTGSIPVLIISSESAPYRDYPRSLESGAEAYLPEPVDPQMLIDVVASLIRARASHPDDLARLRLSTLMENLPDAVWFTDTAGKVAFANRAALREGNLGAADSIDSEEGNHSPDRDRPQGRSSANEEAEVSRRLPGETGRNGRQVKSSPVTDAAGRIVGVLAVVRDITDLDNAEAKLRASEARFHTLAEHSPATIGRFDREHRIVYLSPAVQLVTMRPRESFLGKTAREAGMPPEVCARWEDAQDRAFRGEQVTMHTQIADPTGRRRSSVDTFLPERADDGSIDTVLAISEDRTETAEARESQCQSERLLAADLEAMTRLQKLGTLYVREGNLEAVLDEMVDAAIAISGADFGDIQLLDAKTSRLRIVAQRGFPQWWIDYWNGPAASIGACGTALERGERVIVENVEESPIFEGTAALEIQRRAGVRAVQSTPLVSRPGKLVGMFSTHYRTRYRPGDRALRLLDLLASQAADMIAHAHAERELAAVDFARVRLHALTKRALESKGVHPLFQEAMDAAIDLLGADKGTLQLLEGESLRIVAHLGHERPFLDFFSASETVASVCGEASRRGERVVVEDVERSPLFAGTTSLAVLRAAGVRAVQSTPLITRDRRLLGILTTQWTEPHVPGEDDLQRVDILARQVADIIEHRRAEEELRASEERFRVLTENVQSAVVLIDQRGMTNIVNSAFRRLFDMPSNAAIPNLDSQYWAQWQMFDEHGLPLDVDDRPAYEAARTGTAVKDRLIAVKSPYSTDLKWVLASAEPFSDAEGKLLWLICTYHDITEQKRMATELANRVEELEAVLEAAPAAVWIARDPECREITGNAYADEIIMQVKRGGNISRTALLGEAAVRFQVFRNGVELPPEELPSQIAAATGRPVQDDDLTLVFEDGRKIHLLVSAVPLFDAEGHLRGSVTTGANLTAVKAAEDARYISEQRFRLLVENVQEYALIQTDLEAKVTSWNPGAERLFGYTSSEMLGQDWSLFLTAEDQVAGFLPPDVGSVSKGERHEDGRPLVRKDGTRFWAQWITEPVHDDKGDLRGMAIVIRDETGRRRADEERRRLEELERELLEDRLRTTGAELDRSKEEVRTLAARLLAMQEDERRQLARELHDDLGQRMTVLNFEAMRLEQNAGESREERAKLAELRERLGSFTDELRQIGHRLHPEMLEDLGLEPSLRQLVEEFGERWPAPVDYAVRRLPLKISLPISTTVYRIAQEGLRNVGKHAPGAPLTVLLSGADGVLELTIEDGGPGFDPATGVGEGLGFATIAERVRLHGGTLAIDSQPGSGTTLVVRIPLGADGNEASPLR